MEHDPVMIAEQRFGDEVRRAREARGWSQETVARRLRERYGLDLHQTAIARMELGQRAIRLNEAAALARLLGVDLRPYSGEYPELTADEVEHARAEIKRLRQVEADYRKQLSAAQEQQDVATNTVRVARENRTRLERAVIEYELRHGD